MSSRRALLRTFYLILVTQSISLLGSEMTSIAVGIWIFQETGNATPLAFIHVFAFVPRILLLSVSGWLADRYDRRYVMALTDSGMAIGALLLFIMLGTDTFALWKYYLIVLMNASFSIFQYPAFTAAITQLVPDDQRARANAIQYFTGPAIGIITPGLAVGVYALGGLMGVIALDLLTYLLSFITLMLVRIPRPPTTAEGKAKRGNIWHNLFGGLSFLWEKRTLFGLIIYFGFVNNVLLTTTLVLNTPYLLLLFDDEGVVGLVLGALNAGLALGALAMAVWGGGKRRFLTVVLAMFLCGAGLIAYGMVRQPWLLAGVMLFIAMFPSVAGSAVTALLQAKTAPDLQGRVFAAYAQLAYLLMPLGYLAMGFLADTVFEPSVGAAGWQWVAPLVGESAGSGMGLLMVINGGLMILFSVLVYAVPTMRHMEQTLPDYVS